MNWKGIEHRPSDYDVDALTTTLALALWQSVMEMTNNFPGSSTCRSVFIGLYLYETYNTMSQKDMSCVSDSPYERQIGATLILTFPLNSSYF